MQSVDENTLKNIPQATEDLKEISQLSGKIFSDMVFPEKDFPTRHFLAINLYFYSQIWFDLRFQLLQVF